MENNMHNIQAENQKCFDVVEKIKKYYIEDGLDIYAVVASYIFDVPYADCTLDTQSPKNIARRKFAKKNYFLRIILLMRFMIRFVMKCFVIMQA